MAASPGGFAQCEAAYGHAERIFDLDFHPLNNRIVASASEDVTVRVWSADADGSAYKQVGCLYGHAAEVLRASWSPSGSLLASGSADGSIRVWDLRDALQASGTSYSGRCVAALNGHPEELYACSFLHQPGASTEPPPVPPPVVKKHNAKHGGGGGDDKAGDDGEGEEGDEEEEEERCALNPAAADRFVLAASSESLFLWDLQQQRMIQQGDAPGTSGSTMPIENVSKGWRPAYIFGLALQPAGSLAATVCSDGMLRLWNTAANALEFVGQRAVSRGMVTACAWDSAGKRLAVACKDGSVSILDMTTLTMQPLHHFSVGPLATGCTRVTLPSGADYVAVTTQDAVLRLYSFDDPAAQGQPLELVSPGGYRGPLLVAAASTGSGSGSLRIAVAGEPQDVSTFDASPVATRQAAGKAPAAATAASASVGRPRRGRGAAAAGGGSDPLGLAEMRTASLAGMLEAAAAADQLAGDLGRLDPSLAAAAAAAGMAAPSMPSQHHAPPGGGMPGAPGGGSLSRAPVFIWSL